MLTLRSDPSRLIEEFRRQPYGAHSAALQALLTWLRTRPRENKLIVFREPNDGGLRLCELGGDPVQLTAVADDMFATLDDAERAAFDIRWRENCTQIAISTGDAV